MKLAVIVLMGETGPVVTETVNCLLADCIFGPPDEGGSEIAGETPSPEGQKAKAAWPRNVSVKRPNFTFPGASAPQDSVDELHVFVPYTKGTKGAVGDGERKPLRLDGDSFDPEHGLILNIGDNTPEKVHCTPEYFSEILHCPANELLHSAYCLIDGYHGLRTQGHDLFSETASSEQFQDFLQNKVHFYIVPVLKATGNDPGSLVQVKDVTEEGDIEGYRRFILGLTFFLEAKGFCVHMALSGGRNLMVAAAQTAVQFLDVKGGVSQVLLTRDDDEFTEYFLEAELHWDRSVVKIPPALVFGKVQRDRIEEAKGHLKHAKIEALFHRGFYADLLAKSKYWFEQITHANLNLRELATKDIQLVGGRRIRSPKMKEALVRLRSASESKKPILLVAEQGMDLSFLFTGIAEWVDCSQSNIGRIKTILESPHYRNMRISSNKHILLDIKNSYHEMDYIVDPKDPEELEHLEDIIEYYLNDKVEFENRYLLVLSCDFEMRDVLLKSEYLNDSLTIVTIPPIVNRRDDLVEEFEITINNIAYKEGFIKGVTLAKTVQHKIQTMPWHGGMTEINRFINSILAAISDNNKSKLIIIDDDLFCRVITDFFYEKVIGMGIFNFSIEDQITMLAKWDRIHENVMSAISGDKAWWNNPENRPDANLASFLLQIAQKLKEGCDLSKIRITRDHFLTCCSHIYEALSKVCGNHKLEVFYRYCMNHSATNIFEKNPGEATEAAEIDTFRSTLKDLGWEHKSNAGRRRRTPQNGEMVSR